MHVYEVTPGIYKIFSKIASLKTYRHGYFSKQQNETGYFCGMTLHYLKSAKLKNFSSTLYFFALYFEGWGSVPHII